MKLGRFAKKAKKVRKAIKVKKERMDGWIVDYGSNPWILVAGNSFNSIFEFTDFFEASTAAPWVVGEHVRSTWSMTDLWVDSLGKFRAGPDTGPVPAALEQIAVHNTILTAADEGDESARRLWRDMQTMRLDDVVSKWWGRK